MARLSLISVLVILTSVTVAASADGPALSESMHTSAADTSGVVFQVAAADGQIWAGWQDGIMYSGDNGRTWVKQDIVIGFPARKVSAMLVNDTSVWAATYYDTVVLGGYVYSVHGGLFCNDRDMTGWRVFNLPHPTDAGNITYDLTIRSDTLWTADWWRGLHQSTDGGITWQLVNFNPDFFDPWDSLHHRVFSLAVDDSLIWAGTEGGINYSTDRGVTWQFIRYAGQDSTLSGNRVINLRLRRVGESNEIWAATWRDISSGGQYAVSISSNQGTTWRQVLNGRRAWGFRFHENDAFVPTDSGLWYSSDGGWNFTNLTAGFVPDSLDLYCLAISSDSSLWLGTSGGLYRSDSYGQVWQKVDFLATEVNAQPSVRPDRLSLGQNFPNPFNPSTIIPVYLAQSGEVGLVIFDPLGRKVKMLFDGHLAAGEHLFRWDGRDEKAREVAGGIYFYRLRSGSGTASRSMLLLK